MVTHKPDEPVSVATLQDAHEQVCREWPGRDAPVSVMVAYHQRAAALYDQVAEIDREHRHEALYWAHDERQTAEALNGQPRTSTCSGSVTQASQPEDGCVY